MKSAENNSSDVILLFGANGQVGSELRRSLQGMGEIIAVDVPEVDFSCPESISEVFHHYRPTVVVNAAAYTAVDKAEEQPELAQLVNAAAPEHIAREASAIGACFVHYSTDYVFDGAKQEAYVESDQPNPLSVYGKTKLLGECAAKTCPRHLVFRTSWVVSVHGHNFVKTILRLAKEKDSLRIVDDQIGAPTSAALIADITTVALSQMSTVPSGDSRWGTYHLVSSGCGSWFECARFIVEYARSIGIQLRCSPEGIEPIPTEAYPLPARRPRNSRLSTQKLASTFDVTFPDWRSGIEEILVRLKNNEIAHAK